MNRTINKRNCIGGVVVCWMVLIAGPLQAEPVGDIPAINSPIVRIRYQIPPQMKEKCDLVALWYRVDGKQWGRGGKYKAGESIEFATPDDGVYEFAVVAMDEPGPPDTQTDSSVPTFKCLVDFNQPVVQITGTNYQDGNLVVRWRAFDKNFTSQPIELYLVSDSGNTLLGKFANHSVAVVPVPEKLLPAKAKLVAVDRAGNYGADMSDLITAPKTPAPAATQPATQPTTKGIESSVPESPEAFSVNPEAMREFRLGTTYRLRGQLDLALVHLKRAAEIDPKMPAAHADLAGVFATLGRYNDAVDAYLQALVLDDKSVKAWQGLGMARIRQGQYRQAVFCLEKVTTLDTKNLPGWMYLGDSYWTLGYRSEAKTAWLKAKELVDEESPLEYQQGVEARLLMAK